MPTKEQLTQTVWIKKPFTPEQKIELGRQMADADERLAGKEAELTAEKDAYNETRKRLEGEADAIQLELRNHARMFRQGYEEVKIECVAKYDGSHVMFYDKDGILVEERELTEAEQLRITGKMVDAEDVIKKREGTRCRRLSGSLSISNGSVPVALKPSKRARSL